MGKLRVNRSSQWKRDMTSLSENIMVRTHLGLADESELDDFI